MAKLINDYLQITVTDTIVIQIFIALQQLLEHV